LGACWDAQQKKWYAPEDTAIAKVMQWLPEKVKYHTQTKVEHKRVLFDPAGEADISMDKVNTYRKKGLSQQVFKEIADKVWIDGLRSDLCTNHRYSEIERNIKLVFSAITDEEYREYLSNWEFQQNRSTKSKKDGGGLRLHS